MITNAEKNHKSVLIRDELNGEIFNERYFTKDYSFDFVPDAEGDWAEFMTDDACYFYINGDYVRFWYITPDGVKGYYDKCNLFEYSGEDKVFAPGESKVVWTWRGVRFRPAICYDLRFPVFMHNEGDYDVLLISANFPDSRLLAWDTLVRARAIENMCYVAASNRVGVDEYGTYKGHSVIIAPYGNILAACPDGEQGSATVGLDDEMLAKMRVMHALL